MPLPNLNRQCTANNLKTGNQCKNPAAFGCRTCRFHGAKTLHGRETRTIRAKRSETMAELKVLGQEIWRWRVKP